MEPQWGALGIGELDVDIVRAKRRTRKEGKKKKKKRQRKKNLDRGGL